MSNHMIYFKYAMTKEGEMDLSPRPRKRAKKAAHAAKLMSISVLAASFVPLFHIV